LDEFILVIKYTYVQKKVFKYRMIRSVVLIIK